MPARPSSVDLDPETQRKLAAELFNHTWTLLERTDRDPADDDRMIAAAHASRFFWDDIGQPVHLARGEWQLSRVYATVGRAEPARHHAERCLAICRDSGLGDFDIGFAHEALARASALAGDGEAAAEHAQLARAAAARISKREDRELLLADLATVPA